jgi:hypothetical protein
MPRSAIPRPMDRAADTGHDVTVIFEHAAVVFALPAGATLADVATRIEGVEQPSFGEAMSVDIKLRH